LNQWFSDTVNNCLNEHGLPCVSDVVLQDLYDGLHTLSEYESYSIDTKPLSTDPKDEEIKRLKNSIDSLIGFARSRGFNLGIENNRPCQYVRHAVGASHSSVSAIFDYGEGRFE